MARSNVRRLHLVGMMAEKRGPGRVAEVPITDEIAEEICARLVEGKSLAEICRAKGMPKYRAVFKRLANDPVFARDYARAREAQADADADAINDIAQKVITGKLDPAAARVAIDALKWTAGKRKPLVYGDKLAIGGAADLPPIQTEEVTPLERINRRLAGIAARASAPRDPEEPDA